MLNILKIKGFSTLILAAVAGLALTACQTTGEASGRGDVKLSVSAANSFLSGYMKKPTPLAFAVSEDGRHYSYYFCSASKCRNQVQAMHDSLNNCQSKTKIPCRVFAIRRNIVWQKSDGSPYSTEDVMVMAGLSVAPKTLPYKDLSNIPLCEKALDASGKAWSDKRDFSGYVQEAANRDMSIEFCAKLTGRTG